MSNRLIRAQDAWKDGVPSWVEALVHTCDKSSQNKVAARLRVSGSVVSQIIGNRYPGSMSAMERRVRQVLQAKKVDCPVSKNMTGEQCQSWQDQSHELTSTVPLKVRMYRACRRCPLNPINDEDAS